MLVGEKMVFLDMPQSNRMPVREFLSAGLVDGMAELIPSFADRKTDWQNENLLLCWSDRLGIWFSFSITRSKGRLFGMVCRYRVSRHCIPHDGTLGVSLCNQPSGLNRYSHGLLADRERAFNKTTRFADSVWQYAMDWFSTLHRCSLGVGWIDPMADLPRVHRLGTFCSMG
jgi:hypothetical protein